MSGAAPSASSCDPGAAFAGALDDQFAALPPAWAQVLAPAVRSVPLRRLARDLDEQVAAGRRIYPARPLAALEAGLPRDVRVVILGQDPYHGVGQAHGYAFSVPRGVPQPPSLRNIFRELAREGGFVPPVSGCLTGWARQGVLLLNAVLTVEEGLAGSHARRGWETFTDAVIDAVAATPTPKVFLLWGAQAQAKQERILAAGHARATAVLLANHPSPLSARRAPRPFLGCGHFSQANRFLVDRGVEPIAWQCTEEGSR